MIEVEVNKRIKCDFKDDFFCDIIKATLKKIKISKAKISIAIVGNKEIQNLNLKYRYKDEVTDVLSFRAVEAGDSFELEPNYLGEIILNFPYIVRQAKDLNHSTQKEIEIMLRHGLLHLLGYTHEQMRQLDIEAI
ncbi:MAG: rRNA maturation RNase YbeY [Patescibacteria group bacterium]